MNCDDTARWIDPLLDGELDARNTAEVQAHLHGCRRCQSRYETHRVLSCGIRSLDLGYTAPASLRLRINEMLAAETASAAAQTGLSVKERPTAPRAQVSARRGVSQWLMWAGWPVAVAASAMLATVLLQQRSVEADDVVEAHVRSLLVDHLNDVVSTDHHTVKPWFAGKIDFSPPVPDLKPRGFELVGGRLDYVLREPVAAVIYRKHGHIINVLAALPGHGLDQLPHSERVQGYTLRAWRQAGLDLVAISDIDPRELVNLQEGYEFPPAQTTD
ncbi:MAG TPA: anti-sigma factor [Steroidobacteraceae bacterium]